MNNMFQNNGTRTTNRISPSYYPTQTNNLYGWGNQGNANTSNNALNTNIEQVQGGPVSVNAIQLPPNSLYSYWDPVEPYIYVKAVDLNGRPSMKTLYYQDVEEMPKEEPEATAPTIDTSMFVTKEQFDEMSDTLTKQINDVIKKLNDFKSKVGNVNKKENKK